MTAGIPRCSWWLAEQRLALSEGHVVVGGSPNNRQTVLVAVRTEVYVGGWLGGHLLSNNCQNVLVAKDVGGWRNNEQRPRDMLVALVSARLRFCCAVALFLCGGAIAVRWRSCCAVALLLRGGAPASALRRKCWWLAEQRPAFLERHVVVGGLPNNGQRFSKDML